MQTRQQIQRVEGGRVVNQRIITALEAIVGGGQTFTDPKSLEVFSKDHYWFSPVLTAMLESKRAEVVVAPGTKEELIEVIRLAVREGVPLVVRGAGTGNYGQAVPLAGGILANLHRLNRILEIDPVTKTARVEAGVRMGALERKARELGLELRVYPSTWATCTFGGFVGGGFGGVGSIKHGTLWDGNVLSLEVVPITEDAAPVTVEGWDCAPMIHAYGTTAVMTELRVPLTDAVDWEECALSFPTLPDAIRFARELAMDTSERKREIAVNEWPIPGYFTPLVKADGVCEGRANVLLEVESGRAATIGERAAQYGGTLDWTRGSQDYHAGSFNLTDFTWNHTTLWALKTEPTMTYLQSRFAADQVLDQIALLKEKFGDEILLHLEFIRENVTQDGGVVAAAGLPLVRYTSKERLYEMIEFCESIGVQIADPHQYYLDSDSRWAGDTVLEGVKRWNPHGLLNPGKIRVLETGQAFDTGTWFSAKT